MFPSHQHLCMPAWHVHITITPIGTQVRGTLHVHPFHPDINQNMVNSIISNLRGFSSLTRSFQQFNRTRPPILLLVFMRRIRIEDEPPEIMESEDDHVIHNETNE